MWRLAELFSENKWRLAETITAAQFDEACLWLAEQHDLLGHAMVTAAIYNANRKDRSVWFTPADILGLKPKPTGEQQQKLFKAFLRTRKRRPKPK